MLKGIDVSQWQEAIDFNKVKNAGIKFVILRSSYRKTTDKTFFQNVKGFESVGIPIHGIYHFIYALNDNAALDEAKYCVEQAKKAGLAKSTIIFADFEYDTIENAKKRGVTLGVKQCNSFTKIFCEYVESQGFKAGIYTNIDYYKNWYDKSLLKEYPMWLADYSGDADYECLYHQYSSKGKVDGINGNVDMNYYYGDTATTVLPTNVSSEMTAEKLLNQMRAWIGWGRSNGKHKQIIDIYNNDDPTHLPRNYKVGYNDAYCDTGLSAAAIATGMKSIIGKECGVEQHVTVFEKLGIWNEDGSDVPKAGWPVVFNWGDSTQPNDGYSDHIGIVESVKNGVITSIECNYGGEVRRRTFPVGWGYIRGYAMPKYSSNAGQTSGESNNGGTTLSGSTKLSKEPKWVGSVTASSLNVRKWAGTNFANIKSYPTLSKGNLVDVCDSILDANGDRWYYIRIAGTIFGFVSAKYIKQA